MHLIAKIALGVSISIITIIVLFFVIVFVYYVDWDSVPSKESQEFQIEMERLLCQELKRSLDPNDKAEYIARC